MDRVGVDDSGPGGPEGRAGYRRSAGSRRGEARRQDLLDRVTGDLAENGLVDFSLRRAARAAGTTHKVLLYYFDGADDLLRQVVLQLRERRIGKGLLAATEGPAGEPQAGRAGADRAGADPAGADPAGADPAGADPALADRVRAIWPILVGGEGPVLEQAIGLAMYDRSPHATRSTTSRRG